MLLINSLTTDPLQQFTLTGIPGVEIDILLRFMPRIEIWNADITYGTFNVQGVPLLCSPNILRQWRNIIPFGIAITSIFKLDPYSVNDFAAGVANFFLLNSDDVAAVEANIYS